MHSKYVFFVCVFRETNYFDDILFLSKKVKNIISHKNKENKQHRGRPGVWDGKSEKLHLLKRPRGYPITRSEEQDPSALLAAVGALSLRGKQLPGTL